MDTLVNALSDFIAAVLARFGYVGRARRRAGIKDDLAHLHEFRESPAFGNDSQAHRYLSTHITSEVAKFSGIHQKRKKKRPWSSVVLALLIGVPLAYLTYSLVRDGFVWYALFPGIVGGLMLFAAIGMTIEGEAADDEAEPARAERDD